MATPVLLPKLGNSVESSIIVSWLKQPGDSVAEGDGLCVVETDKSTVEVPCPISGVLLSQQARAGDDVAVQSVIAYVGQVGEVVAAAPAEPAASPMVEAKRDAAAISPRAKKAAGRLQVDPSALQGTGPGGRIIERDISASAAAQPKLTPVARAMVRSGDFVPVAKSGSGPAGRMTSRDLAPAARTEPGQTLAESTLVPFTSLRKRIGERMLASLAGAAQLTLNTSADARALQAYRAKLKASPESFGLRDVSINDLVLFAVARALPGFPEINAVLEGQASRQFARAHLGFAVDTSRGLFVPVIRSADRLTLKQLSLEARGLAAACRDGAASPDQLSGGSFTVSNLGGLSIESFTPILNPPQVAILGVGAISLKPVEQAGAVAFVPHLSLSLTIDHAVVDGAPAARFLQALCAQIAQFELTLAQ